MMPSVAATTEKPREQHPDIRRFHSADLTTHGPWLFARLAKGLNLDEWRVAGWLRGTFTSNEFMILYQEHSVALAQLVRGDLLDGTPTIHVKFVLAESEAYVEEASRFYETFRQWGESLGAKVLVLEDLTDVPEAAIKKAVGSVFVKQQMFARV